MIELIASVAQKMKNYNGGSSLKVIMEIFKEVSEVPNLDLIINQESLNYMINTLLETVKKQEFQRYLSIQLLQSFTNLARQRYSLSQFKGEINKLLRVHYLDSSISKHCSHSIEIFEKGLECGYFSYKEDLQRLLSHLDKHDQIWIEKDLISILKLTVISQNEEPAATKQKRLATLKSKITTTIMKKYRFFIVYEFFHQFSQESLDKQQLAIGDPADLREIESRLAPHISELMLPANSIRYHSVLPIISHALVEFDPQIYGSKLQALLQSLDDISFSHILLNFCESVHLMSVYDHTRQVPEAFRKFIFYVIGLNLDRIIRIRIVHRIMRFISSSDWPVFKSSSGDLLPEFVKLVDHMNQNSLILSDETVTSIDFTSMRKFYLRMSSLGFADQPFLKELVIRITKKSYNDLDMFSLLEHFDLLLEIDLETSREFAKSPAVIKKIADVQKMLMGHSISSLSTLNRLMRMLLFLVEETPTKLETTNDDLERNSVMWVLKGMKRAGEKKPLLFLKEDYLKMIEQAKEKVRSADCRSSQV